MAKVIHRIINSKCNFTHHYKQFLMATIAYVLANVYDYIVTLYGLKYTDATEANPIAVSYINLFGAHIGLLIFKSLIVSFVVLGMIAIFCLYKNKKTRLNPEYLLSIGTALTFLSASMWFVHF